jgi:hypothetical protein
MPVVEPGGSSLIETLVVALKSSIGVRAPVRLFVRPAGTVGLHGRFISGGLSLRLAPRAGRAFSMTPEGLLIDSRILLLFEACRAAWAADRGAGAAVSIPRYPRAPTRIQIKSATQSTLLTIAKGGLRRNSPCCYATPPCYFATVTQIRPQKLGDLALAQLWLRDRLRHVAWPCGQS